MEKLIDKDLDNKIVFLNYNKLMKWMDKDLVQASFLVFPLIHEFRILIIFFSIISNKNDFSTNLENYILIEKSSNHI